MPALLVTVKSPADHVLLAGLPHLQPVLDELGAGVLLIGGLATTAWLGASPADLPIRATRDVDLGLDRADLGLIGARRIKPMLDRHSFSQRAGDESFRFTRKTNAGDFVVDLLLPRGASRNNPPMIEPGLASIAVPGLAYGLARGADELDLTLVFDSTESMFRLPIARLDAMLVMKAGLVASGARTRRDRRTTDTADAVMLAAACRHHPAALRALQTHRNDSEPKRALRWLGESFTDPRSAAARRIEDHLSHEHDQRNGGRWAVDTVAEFFAELRSAPRS